MHSKLNFDISWHILIFMVNHPLMQTHTETRTFEVLFASLHFTFKHNQDLYGRSWSRSLKKHQNELQTLDWWRPTTNGEDPEETGKAFGAVYEPPPWPKEQSTISARSGSRDFDFADAGLVALSRCQGRRRLGSTRGWGEIYENPYQKPAG